MNGSIEVELATRILIPRPDGATDVKFLASGRLRCTPNAATNLRNALDAALKMLEQPDANLAAIAAFEVELAVPVMFLHRSSGSATLD